MTSQWIKKSESWLIWIIFTVSVCLRGLSMFAFCWREMGHAADDDDPYANHAAPTMWNLSLSCFLPRGSLQSNCRTVALSNSCGYFQVHSYPKARPYVD